MGGEIGRANNVNQREISTSAHFYAWRIPALQSNVYRYSAVFELALCHWTDDLSLGRFKKSEDSQSKVY